MKKENEVVFNTVHKGYWFFGKTGFTGRKRLFGFDTGKYIVESRTLFSLFGRTYGLQFLVNSYDKYDEDALSYLDEFCDVTRVFVNDMGETIAHVPYSFPDNEAPLPPVGSTEFLYCYTHNPLNGKRYGLGDPAFVLMLLNKGIRDFEFPSEEDMTCSVGYNPFEEKWYGWSHGAILGFGVGSEVKKGDIAYMPETMVDWVASHMSFFDYTQVEEFDEYFLLNNNNDRNRALSYRLNKDDFVEGHGEWTAIDIHDAKQMAYDFARNVS